MSLTTSLTTLVERLEPEQYETLSKEPKVEVSRTIATENKYLHFRTNKAPFDNPMLRLAASHAIDRSQVLEVMGVAGHESNNYISPVKFGYVDLENYPTFDPAKCQELLSQAGFPNGQGLPELEYLVSTGFYPKTKEYGEVVTATGKNVIIIGGGIAGAGPQGGDDQARSQDSLLCHHSLLLFVYF